MKKIIFVLTILISTISFGQDIPLGDNFFKADFTLDSVTLGIESNQINLSGDVGLCLKNVWMRHGK